ncbi:MAG: plastocyanin/azurin family copper-binding protein [Actinomycetota bacterium]
MRILCFRIAFAALLAAGVACSTDGGAGDGPERPSVTVQMFKFAPASVRVRAGTTVRWRNTDEVLHTVTAGTPQETTGRFDGDLDGAGTAFRFTFEEPGSYPYFCSRHPFMRGEVLVQG